MKLNESLLRRFSETARKLGVEGTAAKLYLSFTSAIRSQLKQEIKALNFDKIDPEEHEKTAFFPEFYSTDYRTTLHGVIAHALNYRGVGSVFIFEDGSLNASMGYTPKYDDEKVRCVRQNEEFSEVMNLPSVFLDEIGYDSSPKSREVESKIENHAVSSALRKLHVAEIDYDNDEHVQLVEEFKRTGRVAWEVTDRLHEKHDFDYVVSTSSPYLPRRIVLEYANSHDIPITAGSDPRYGDSGKSIIFSRMDGPLVHYISEEAWQKIRSKGLNANQKSELDNYMQDRMRNTKQTKYAESGHAPELDGDADLYSMYTHLPWDAAIQGVSRIFENQYEWISETVSYFESLEGKRLIIKVHPAEELRTTKQGVTDVLEGLFESLPKNVDVLEADTDVDPYELIRVSDAVLVYTSTVGMEATYLGTPAITTANSHYAHKGFTHDPETYQEYREILDEDPSNLTPNKDMGELVKNYLYNYFIQRPVPFELVQKEPYSSDKSMVENLGSLDDIKPGGDEVLDDVCKAIIENTSYFYTKTHE